MINISNPEYEEMENSELETVRYTYAYLYELGNLMFKYYDGIEVLSQEEINMIVNSSDSLKLRGMYLAACDRNRIQYSYPTFSINSDNIDLAKKRKRQ